MQDFRLIITDDDQDDVDLIRTVFARYSPYEFIHLQNGKLLVDHFEQELQKGSFLLPDLIILDVNMPVMDGIEALTIPVAEGTRRCADPYAFDLHG